MSLDLLPVPGVSAASWWEQRRWRYDRYLFVALWAAFFCLVWLLEIYADRLTIRDEAPEVTLFTVLGHGMVCLVVMGFANACYFLGPCLECRIPDHWVDEYRYAAWPVGTLFSCLLPFLAPFGLWLRVR